jgi:two-component system CheB/CheR fusion protein
MDHEDGDAQQAATDLIGDRANGGGDGELEELLVYLRSTRGFDFTQYKRTSLTRRIRRRLADTGRETYGAYLDLLEAEPAEFNALLDTVLINVTSFFRDAEFWDVVRERIIPELLDRHADGSPSRAWSAGCATGQEPYSLAILFAEQLGLENLSDRIKIYATDVDENALTTARRATYSPHALEGLPAEYFDKYFESVPGEEQLYVLNNDLRRCVIFGQHNLVSDAPISRVDLLMCRNTLMYFNAALQHDVVRRMHFSVVPDGYLALGKVEMLLGHRALFDPLDGGVRIFKKQPNGRTEMVTSTVETDPFALPKLISLAHLAFDASTVAQVVVGRDGVLEAANEAARSMFDVRRLDIGRPFRDLELSYRPTELRAHIDSAIERGEQITVKDVPANRTSNGETYYDVVLTPLTAPEDTAGVLVTFIDVSRHHTLQDRLEEARQDLETAYEEVQSTNEELETTNEELQSTNEELETTNEELQSTIEELETTNEELRSTNEEFETMNDELQRVNDQLEVRARTLQERTAELDQARRYMSSVLNSIEAGIVVVDSDVRTVTWSSGAQELWGIRQEEAIGRSLLGLDIGLPIEQLARPIRDVLAGSERTVIVDLAAHNRRGRTITCRVECSGMVDGNGSVQGVVLVMEAADRDGDSA